MTSVSRTLAIVGVGLLVRIAIYPFIDIGANLVGGDTDYYLSGGSGFRAPLYSLVASTLGPAVIALQAIINLGMGVATYLVLRRDGEIGAFIAGGLIAANPFLVFMEARILSEVLYGALVFGAFLTLYRARTLWAGAIAGASLGLAILTRDTLIVLPLLVLPFRFKQGLVLCAVAYMISLPWYASNSTNGRAGLNLWIGTWERDPSWMDDGMRFPDHAYRSTAEQTRLEEAFDNKDDRPFNDVAIDRMKSQPFAVLTTWIVRYPRLWLGTRSELNTFRFERGSILFRAVKSSLWGLNLLLLSLGFLAMWKERRRFAGLAIPIAYTAVIYVPFHNTEPRYSLMAMPFLMVALGWATASAVAGRWRPIRSGEPTRE